MSRYLQSFLARVFSIDPRALAAFRVTAGLIILADLAVRATDLHVFYTDAGATPRSLLSDWRFPGLHVLSGSMEWQAGLFILAGLFAVALIVGWHTRVMTILTWYMLASLQSRNFYLLNSGDSLLRMMLFWGMFLPLGNVWSWDAWRKQKQTGISVSLLPIFSVAGACLLFQTCLMYLISAYAKYNEIWREGDALYYTFSYDAYARPLATYMLQYPEVLRWLSVGALALEGFGPVLVLSPWRTKLLRLLVIPGFVALHISIEFTLTVGLFSYASLLAWIPFLPDTFWNFFTPSTERYESPPVSEDELVPPTKRRWQERISDVVCLGTMAYVLLYCYTTTYLPFAKSDLMKQAARPASVLMLTQNWGMFGKPTRDDGWCIAAARLADGSTVDLLRDGAPLNWDKPDRVTKLHPNHRWRKYFRTLVRTDRKKLRSPMSQYLARTWDQNHEENRRVLWLDLYLVKEWTPTPGEPLELRQILLHHERVGAQGAFAEAMSEMNSGSSDAPSADNLPPGL